MSKTLHDYFAAQDSFDRAAYLNALAACLRELRETLVVSCWQGQKIEPVIDKVVKEMARMVTPETRTGGGE